MAMTEEQLKEQIELDRMIAQAEIDRDPIIQDERVQLSVPPGGTGDDMYGAMGAIDPREVGVEALNAGALTDEEFMMAEEFMNALPPEAQESFMDRLMNDPRATMRSVMDTLGQMFGGEPDAPMGALGRIGSGSTSNAELDAYRNAMNVEGSGPMTDAELDAFRRQRMSMDNR